MKRKRADIKSLKIYGMAVIFLTVAVAISLSCLNVIFVKPLNINNSMKYGIIDGNLYKTHLNIENKEEQFTNTTVTKKQHGDLILNFLEEIAPGCSFYYYNAERDGKITSESIIEGLNSMIEAGVDCVSISLSSKIYSDELDNWITDNSDELKVYASYNNNLNTYDYPASYDEVIGIGTEKTLSTKSNDIIYRTNNIIILSTKLKYYHGNSYLTPYTMLKNE